MRLSVAAASLLALTSCAAAPSPSASVCPAPMEYSRAEEAQAAAELKALSPNSILAAMIRDYGAERAVLTACLGH